MPPRPAIDRRHPRDAPDLVQDLAPARRLGDARRDLAARRRARRVRRRVDERPPHRHGPGGAGAVAGGASTLLATLVHHVPGCGWVTPCCRTPSATPSSSPRRPRSSTTRPAAGSCSGLGAGWFENEHGPFGIDLPPIGERIDRLISAVEVIRLLFSAEAASPPGVTRDDRFYPLDGATNLPPPLTPGRARRSSSAARSRAGSASRRAGPPAGCSPGPMPATP